MKIYAILVALVMSLVIGTYVIHEQKVQHEHKVATQRVAQKAKAQQQALQYMYGGSISGENTPAPKAGVPSDLKK
jgi:triosephosphate isomerase